MTEESCKFAESGSAVGLDLVHVESFITALVAAGYAACKIADKRRIARKFVIWTQSRGILPDEVGDHHLVQYLETTRPTSKARSAFKRSVLRALLGHLRREGVVAEAAAVRDDSPAGRLEREYSDYLRDERGLVFRSLLVYVPRVRAFLVDRVAEVDSPRPEDIDAQAVRIFLLRRVQVCSREQGRLWVVAMRSFLRFLFARGYTRSDLSASIVMFRKPRAQGTHPFLSLTEVEAVLATPDLSTVIGRRDRAILLLLARLGLRAGEVVALELSDIRWRVGELVVRGKGRIHDRLPLPADVGEALAVYIRLARPEGACRRVFLRGHAPHVGFSGPCAIDGVVRKALARAGLPHRARVAAHALRHSLATQMIRRGASLPEISQVLRHRSPGTAEIYAKVAFDSLREVAMSWPGKEGAR